MNPVPRYPMAWETTWRSACAEAVALGFRGRGTRARLAPEDEERADTVAQFLDERALRLSAPYGGGRFSNSA